METCSFAYFSPLSPRTRFLNPKSFRGRGKGPRLLTKKLVIHASDDNGEKSDTNGGKSPVDENMIVLRMRIKRMKMLEAVRTGDSTDDGQNDPVQSQDEWNDWDKKSFVHYNEKVCDIMGLLQSYLMNTRPSLAVGMLALAALSMPLSSSVVMGNVLKVVRGLLAGCHVCIDIEF